MNILILITFMARLVIVLSDSREDQLFKELCSESYFDRLLSTTPLEYAERKQLFQVFHLYRRMRVPHQWFYYYWNVTVKRSGVNNTLKAVSIESKTDAGPLPPYQLRVNYTSFLYKDDKTVISIEVSSTQEEDNEWCTAYGFNALDERYHFLCENLTEHQMNVKHRSQFVGQFYRKVRYEGVRRVVDFRPNHTFGKIPVFEFLGIDCSKQEVTTEEEGDDDDDDNPFLWFFSSFSDEFFYIYAAVALIFAFILPALILWILEGRYRFTEEIYNDSRLGSQSDGRSATHSSIENGPADLRGLRRVRPSQMTINKRGHLNA